MRLVTVFQRVGLTGVALLLVPVMAGAQSAPAFELAPLGFAPASSNSRSFLGVGVQEIDSERAKALKLKEEYGVEITRVDEDSPAEHAGLKPGDIVQSYNGQRVEGTEQFIRMVRETPPGRTAKLTVERNGETQTINVQVGARRAPAVVFNTTEPPADLRDFRFEMPDMPRAMMAWRNVVLGVEAEPLGDTQLATYFRAREVVLVRSVIPGSAAAKAGLTAGDVLTKVEQDDISTPRDISTALRAARDAGKKSVALALLRDHKPMSLTVPLKDAAPRSTPRVRGTRVSN
jgi:serine protease Do